MKENNTDLIKDTIENIGKESYNDLIKPSFQETGGIFGTLFGLINHVLLYKPKSWIIKYKYKLEQYAEEQKRLLSEIPEDRRIEPKLNIMVPCLESIVMNLDDDLLQKMFLTILTNSCDKEWAEYVHPAFVEILKQLSSDEAKICIALAKEKNKLEAKALVDVRLFVKDTFSKDTDKFLESMQERNIGKSFHYDLSHNLLTYNRPSRSIYRNMCLICEQAKCKNNLPNIYLTNLQRLGLIEIEENKKLNSKKPYKIGRAHV